MFRCSLFFSLLLALVSCGDAKEERELRRKAVQDSINRADSIYKSGKQYEEYLKAGEDSILQENAYREKIEQDSIRKAQEVLKFKWKHRKPPLPAPKILEKQPNPPKNTGN